MGEYARIDGRVNVYRFRSPFPDEDNTSPVADEAYERVLLLPFSSTAADPWTLNPEEHADLRMPDSAAGAYNVNVGVHCPATGKNEKQSPVHGWPVEIVQQKPVEGALWLVLRCGWCGKRYWLTPSDALSLCMALDAVEHSAEYWHEIAGRIRAGYGLTIA